MTNRNKGILYMIISSLFLALNATAIKLLNEIPTMEKMFFRNFIGFLVSGYLVIKSKKSFRGNNKKYLIYRSVLGFLGVSLYFYSIVHLPLADAVILNQLNPFFIIIFAALFLEEKVQKIQVPAISLAFLGLVFITQPQFSSKLFPVMVGILASIIIAIAFTMVRFLRLTDSPDLIIFYLSGISTIMSIPFLIFGKFILPNKYNIIPLLGVGTFSTLSQYFLTHAYRYAEAGDLSIYSYGTSIFSVFIGIILWREIPSLLSIFGLICILIAAYWNYKIKCKQYE